MFAQAAYGGAAACLPQYTTTYCTDDATDPHASRTLCSADMGNGYCGYSCQANWMNCDDVATNGCEINVNTDADNCGACSSTLKPCTTLILCYLTQAMRSGECGYPCPGQQVCCDGTCSARCATFRGIG